MALDVGALHAAHWSAIVGYFRNRHFGGSIHECEDLAATVFEKLARHADRYHDDGAALGLLFMVASRVWLDYKRAQNARPVLVPFTHTGGGGDFVTHDPVDPRDPFSDVEHDLDAAGDVDRLLAPLLPEQRQAIERHVLWGEPLSATGASLGISRDAVKKRCARGLERLRKHLEQAS